MKYLPLVGLDEGVELCLHLAGEGLPAVVRGAGGDHQAASGGCRGLGVSRVCEEESVGGGQLEPGLQDHVQPAVVELLAGLH